VQYFPSAKPIIKGTVSGMFYVMNFFMNQGPLFLDNWNFLFLHFWGIVKENNTTRICEKSKFAGIGAGEKKCKYDIILLHTYV